jgi:sodium pump decarboxylase gamma subunit
MNYMSFLNFSKEVASDLSLSEKLNSILTTGVGGYLLVFVVLALIWFILAIFGKAFEKKEKPEKEEAPAPTPAPVAPAPAAPVADDTAVVAAIVAAISAYTGKPAGGFRVVSFRKKH